QIIETVKNLPEQPARLRLSYEPDNIVAEKFYAKYGFEKTGEIIDGEAVADLWFKR
ncbi:GNAT family N-acetyltransferase, partial [Listeria monocytogenes]|nr:GNAT family N-acetyltransferase [Listeria monocytogenes]